MICLNWFELLIVLDLILSNFVLRLHPDILGLIKHLLGQLDTVNASRRTARIDCQLCHLAKTTLKLASALHVSAKDQLFDSQCHLVLVLLKFLWLDKLCKWLQLLYIEK